MKDKREVTGKPGGKTGSGKKIGRGNQKNRMFPEKKVGEGMFFCLSMGFKRERKNIEARDEFAGQDRGGKS